MFGFLKKIFGTAQSRILKRYAKTVREVVAIEEKLQSLSEDELKAKTDEFKKRYREGESLDSILPEAYAVVKNACRRLCGSDVNICGYEQKWDMIPYDVQILGAIAMHHGSISEMQTGEGKTLTASMPLYLNALSEKGVHLVTVNDYLAKRDCEWIGSVFRYLGLTVSALTNDVPPQNRKEIYASDIVYGTASEFGFDYLRDNSMAMNKNDQAQRSHFFAIVDEIDSILIDEARTPLIISGPVPESRQMYDELKVGVSNLVKAQRDLCNRLATEARKELDKLGQFEEEPPKLSKYESEQVKQAFHKLYLVSKGTPRNKILTRVRENPDARAEIDKWETYYVSQQNKEERAEALSELFIIVDERASEYELTDKGIQNWTKHDSDPSAKDDFTMLDLGHEYALIDQNTDLDTKQKVEEKIKLREEDSKRKERAHNLRQLFRSHLLMENDVDYIVQDNKIIIIDENTGRPQPGRRFSDGLHQAIEAKEGVEIQGETQTYATITLQNYFRMYEKLAGMTGTAITEAQEFKQIYQLEVLEIPTYVRCKRKDFDDEIYMTEREKYLALLKEIKECHEKGQPMLIGTESVEISEKLSRILKQNSLPHTVLNAKNHASEAEIIANAGVRGAITIATNMAGRGTDIKLKEGVKETGGLHVIGTTRHQSRRIDRQLRGRSGRLGDPGASKFFVSFEDSLMRLFASPRMTALLQRFRPPEGEPISASVLNKSIETAQKRVEQRNYTIRKHTLEYDDVMNKQRQEIYSFRNEILHTEDPILMSKDVLENTCSLMAQDYFVSRTEEHLWNPQGYRGWLTGNFPVKLEDNAFDDDYSEVGEIEDQAVKLVLECFDTKIESQIDMIQQIRPDTDADGAQRVLREVIRNLMIRKIDSLWQEHLLSIDHLRSDVGLRAVGQKDPLLEFKHEAFTLFEDLSHRLRTDISRDLFRFEMVPRQPQPLAETLSKLQLHTQKFFTPEQQEAPQKEKIQSVVSDPKVGRNNDCPCGSGKKYKKCCGQNQPVS